MATGPLTACLPVVLLYETGQEKRPPISGSRPELRRGADELAVVLQVDGLGRQWLGLDGKTAVGFREALLDA